MLAVVNERLKLHQLIFNEKQMHEIYKDKPRVSLIDDDKSMEEEPLPKKKNKPLVSDGEDDFHKAGNEEDAAGSEQEEDLFWQIAHN